MKNQETAWLLKEKYHGQKTEGFLTDRARLEAGEPLAYIIGSIPFLDCVIHLDSKPLIPRPETEFWVEQAIAVMKAGEASPRPLHVLDLCAGSGAIGVAVAKAIPEANITFAEIDETHLPVIKKNLTQNLPLKREALGGQYHLVVSDLFKAIPEGTFDFILTNPPYIDDTADTVDEGVVAHEPHRALFGGADGLELINTIITEAPKYLTADGQLWIEHEPFQVNAIVAFAAAHGFNARTYPDQYATPRYSVLMKSVPK